MFYYGFDNYMSHAFPEDELRPISCTPLTRDRANPSHVEINDVLGNYSLTLIDSLSTLAILASSSPKLWGKNIALDRFQNGIRDLVVQYGDGTKSHTGCGMRSCGFDLDSKVQVFETVIRGVGGLLSAHLFAVGDLPIRGYQPSPSDAAIARTWNLTTRLDEKSGIKFSNGFVYNGQLLRLAYDLGDRLIPAFFTATGIPYPRVNLREGIPFYANSPANIESESGQCDAVQNADREITETCSAGAGSLILEFTVLSRLTGDSRFEDLAKRAFWSVWEKRSDIGLIGSGIDAENAQWISPYTGIGAGIDSFFEYAFKSHVLLSRDVGLVSRTSDHAKDPRELFEPLQAEHNSPAAFLQTWSEAHNAIKHHLYRGPSYQHPHYIQGDLFTGATRAFWIDSLSAYYPGLLTLAGEVDEAAATHLLTTALWTRYSALPERWSTATGDIEGGLGWWGGRPEFAESNWYLDQSTKDPWYLYVGEMILRDIKRRCWTTCGWAGLQDVKTGELNDRMESFFLGETAKYLFLLFDPDHPLNHFDAPFVFTTEGHPLVIPASLNSRSSKTSGGRRTDNSVNGAICPVPQIPDPCVPSQTAARGDIFHAAALARLDLMPPRNQDGSPLMEYSTDRPSVSIADLRSPSNYTYYPWTLPPEMVPLDATCAPIAARPTFDISFPPMPNMQPSIAPLQRVKEGIFINSVGGLRLGMIQDMPLIFGGMPGSESDSYRIQAINNLALGKDEKVYLAKDPTFGVLNPSDPNFTRVKDLGMLDIVLDVENIMPEATESSNDVPVEEALKNAMESLDNGPKGAFKALLDHVSAIIADSKTHLSTINSQSPSPSSPSQNVTRYYVAAMVSTGLGSAPIPDWPEAPSPTPGNLLTGPLMWSSIYIGDELCNYKLDPAITRTHQLLVLKRGGCSFSHKLANIPSVAPSSKSLQFVIIVSYEEHDVADGLPPGSGLLIRPLLDQQQFTSGGLPRHNPLPMVLVGGGDATYQTFRAARAVGVKRRYKMEAQGVTIGNLIVV